MLTNLDQQPHTPVVHPVRHLVIILACLAGTGFVDLSHYPEIPAVAAYAAMLVASVLTATHWIYIARHKSPEPETSEL